MRFAQEAERLVNEAKAVPGFPFLDWPETPQSLLSLISTWDGIFETAAGAAARDFAAFQDTGLTPDSPILFLRNDAQTRGFRIWSPTAANPDDVAFFFGQIMHPEDSHADGRVRAAQYRCELELASDLNVPRVAACMDMIARFLAAEITSQADVAALDAAFVAEYGALFPRPTFEDDGEDEEDDG